MCCPGVRHVHSFDAPEAGGDSPCWGEDVVAEVKCRSVCESGPGRRGPSVFLTPPPNTSRRAGPAGDREGPAAAQGVGKEEAEPRRALSSQ